MTTLIRGFGSVQVPYVPRPAPAANVVFLDHFNGAANSALGSGTWTVSGVPGANNWEILTGPAENGTSTQYVNSVSNAYMDGASNLVIACTAGTGGYTVNTAEITTGSLSLPTWGTYSASIKCTPMTGYWPAWWAVGIQPPTWPACGEVDCLENFGGGYGQPLGRGDAGVWGGGPYPQTLNLGSGLANTVGDGRFHTYGWVIPSDYSTITFLVDGQVMAVPAGRYNPMTPADWVAHANAASGDVATTGNFPFGASFPYQLRFEVNAGANGVYPVNPALTQTIMIVDWVAVTQP